VDKRGDKKKGGEGRKEFRKRGNMKDSFLECGRVIYEDVSNRDKDFWKGISEWDVVTLSETWVDEKG